MTSPALPRPLRVAGAVFAWVSRRSLLVLAVVALGWVSVRGAIAADYLRSAKASASDVVAEHHRPRRRRRRDRRGRRRHGERARPHERPGVAHARAHAVARPAARRRVGTVAEAADDVAAARAHPARRRRLDALGRRVSPGGRQGRARRDSSPCKTPPRSRPRRWPRRPTRSTASTPAPSSPRCARSSTRSTPRSTDTANATEALANASVLLPAMLGADGPRNYLVLFQNNAEWRSLGGIAGAAALIRTDGGSMQLVAAGLRRRLSALRPAGARARPRDQRRSTGSRPSQWFHNVTQVPDFSVTAPDRAADVGAQARSRGRRCALGRPRRAVVPARRDGPGHPPERAR